MHVKCAIELILHKNYYTKYEEKSLNLKSSSYKEACEEALKRYALSSVGLMHAAASGIYRNIQSYYPTVNEFTDHVAQSLNLVLPP